MKKVYFPPYVKWYVYFFWQKSLLLSLFTSLLYEQFLDFLLWLSLVAKNARAEKMIKNTRWLREYFTSPPNEQAWKRERKSNLNCFARRKLTIFAYFHQRSSLFGCVFTKMWSQSLTFSCRLNNSPDFLFLSCVSSLSSTSSKKLRLGAQTSIKKLHEFFLTI